MTERADTSVSSTKPANAARVDHRQVPMMDHIRDLRRREIVPYLSIGHRLGAGADPEIVELLGQDLFASNAWVSSTEYEAALEQAERLAADAWGAERSFYLVDGSSAGNHAFLLATLRPGDKVLVSRDLHWSLMVAIILTGARPIYLSPRVHPDLDVGSGIDPEDVEAALQLHPDVSLIAVVSPSWCGVASDLRSIASIVHARNIPLYVDEAWGPHYHAHPALPDSAMTSGADASVTSVHKILPAVSQGSVLHLQGERVDYNRVATAVRMMSTTSPMLPIVASLDAARRQMAISGTQLYERVLSLSDRARQEISAIGGYELLTAEALGIPERRHDRTKLVIDVHRLGLTGYDVEHQLNHQHAIAIESADWRGIVANFNIAETDESANRFVNALRSIVDGSPGQERSEIGTRATGKLLDAPVQSMLPRDAYFAHSRQVRLTESVGEVAAELVTPYPPGIPVLAPGELITADRVAYLMGIYKRGAVNYGNHHWSVDRMISVVAEPV